jgi:hypothetical protein
VPVTWSPTNDLVTDEHPSVAVTNAVLGSGIVALQPSVSVGGHVIEGGVTSTILVMICVQVAELPQSSVAL